MNDFEQAYISTVAREAVENIREHNLSTEQLSDEQRQVLCALLEKQLWEMETDDDRT